MDSPTILIQLSPKRYRQAVGLLITKLITLVGSWIGLDGEIVYNKVTAIVSMVVAETGQGFKLIQKSFDSLTSSILDH